jgi:hypothetical protein
MATTEELVALCKADPVINGLVNRLSKELDAAEAVCEALGNYRTILILRWKDRPVPEPVSFGLVLEAHDAYLASKGGE